jgi:S1-C subfamily serine protease
MESPSLRRFYGMGDEQTGVLITAVNPLSPVGAAGLQAEDVLVSMDGVSIADDGTIDFRDDERVGLEHLFGMCYD